MEERFTRSVICPTLIGREGDLATLQWLVEETKCGQGRVAFVSGEAGVGKSRLITETAHFAEQQGFFDLQGQCFQTDSALPYAPFLDLLRSYMMASTPEQIVQEWEPIAPELLRLLPEVRGLIPAFASVLPLPALDPQQEKRRLFGAMTHFCTRLVTRQPLLLVVEDLHWCDDIGLECLFHLARHTARLPLFLLLSYRNDEVSARLRHWLATFDRGHLAQEVVLARLSLVDVDAMLQAIFALHASLHTGLLGSIYALTDGNPFFIEEVLKSLVASGEIAARNGVWERTLLLGTHQHRPPIPRSVQDAVHQRSEHLTPLAQQLLTLAAVAGRRFDFSVLRSILHLDEQQMLPLVKELMEAQFIVEESEDRFSFRHALTRQAIYSKLLIRERKALHRTLAETIEALHPSAFAQEALVVDLAYHFFEGAVWSKALEYGQRAALRSVALYAPRAAIEHFTRALQAQSHLQELPSAELHRARGQAYETLGEFERARRDYEQALHIARHTQDGIMEWQSLLDMGFLWVGRDYEQAGQWLRQALDLAQRLADHQLQAQSLNRLGMARAIYGDTVGAVDHLRRAIALFRTQNDQQHLISSLTSYIAVAGPSWVETTYSVSDHLENCVRVATEALHLAQQTGSLHAQWTAGAYFSLGRLSLLLLEPALAMETLKKGQMISSEISSAWWTGNFTAYLAQACILKGVLPRAEAALKAVIARDQTPRSSPERRMIWAWGELALANDEPGVALDIAERLLSSVPGAHQEQPIPWLLRLKARALIASGRMKEALEVLEAAKSGLLARQERPLLWQIHALLGQVHTYLKQEEQARQEFVAASRIIHALKATIDDDYLREHFSRTALKTLPRELSLSGAATAVEQFHGLSEREYTVATLVAEGKTNREIAQTLIVGERTVETHVSNILAKLAFTSRKQIAAWRLQQEEKS